MSTIKKSVAPAEAHVALLRGINVGGNNKLPMKDLVLLFEAAGCGEVRSYIQSGNVVFRAPAKLVARVPALLGASIEQRFGFRPPMVLRSAAALANVAAANPYLAAGEDPDRLHVAFLSATPAPARVAALDPDRSPPDRFTVQGDTIYLSLPNGVGKSRVTNAWLDSRLDCVSTLRNWRTVVELLAMCR